jgi:hypothetical protein
MDKDAIDNSYTQIINTRGIGKQLELTRQKIWNYRNTQVSLGTKLEVLFKMDRLRFKDGWDD